MTMKSHKTLKASLREHTGNGRCDLHAFMWRRRRALAKVLDKASPEWTGTAAALAELGVTGMHGQPPTASSVRSMWRRIRREAAADEAAKAAQRSARPPVNRAPRAAGPPPLAEQARPAVTQGRQVGWSQDGAEERRAIGREEAAGSGGEIELSPEAEAKFAALRERLAYADRHLGPQPKRKA